MKIVYVHHADRDRYNGSVPRQDQDITEEGILLTKSLGKKLPFINPTAIYTSPYKRCMHTAELLKGELDIPIIEDERFNEYEAVETYKEFLKRNISAIEDIISNYNDDDVVLCVTSGVNLSAFMCYFSGLKPSNDCPKCQALSLSPVLFSTDGFVL